MAVVYSRPLGPLNLKINLTLMGIKITFGQQEESSARPMAE